MPTPKQYILKKKYILAYLKKKIFWKSNLLW